MSVMVSVGMPAYNGEKFIRESIESILSQDYEDFELIISDNCSTDSTAEICQIYATRDERIRFYKSDKNRGAAWNYNRVFNLSRGRYFKWAADDDLCAETFLSECVAVLENSQEAVIAFSYTPHVDLHGNMLGKEKMGHDVGPSLPVNARFKNLVCNEFGDDCRPVFGLIRTKALSETALIGNYIASDQVILAELILRGPFIEIPKPLQFRRMHPTGTERCYRGRHRERVEWFEGNSQRKFIFPQWNLLGKFLKAIQKAPITGKDKLLCYIEVIRWLRWGRARMLMDDLEYNIRKLIRQ